MLKSAACLSFLLLVNKQGQTRLAQYYEARIELANQCPRQCGDLTRGCNAAALSQHVPVEERRVLEGEIVRKCLARSDKQCSIVEHRNYKARAARFLAHGVQRPCGGYSVRDRRV